MATPADSSGANAPVVRVIRRAAPLAPTARLMAAISALDTLLSAVTTTWDAAASMYQETPWTPDLSTARFAADSALALYRWGAALAPVGTRNRPTATAETAATSSRPMRPRG